MRVKIKYGRPGTWYEDLKGSEYEVEEQANAYGDHLVLDCSDGYNRWINKFDIEHEERRNNNSTG